MLGSFDWRSQPVFITSTFCDMHAERDWLQTRVFPELDERLRGRRRYLELIDLRWGVDTTNEREEHDRDLLVLKVCLAEIDRSRPFLIGLLGDRYGWVPPTERMEAAAREAGFDRPVGGRSVTDLEIDYGVLASSDQRKRCFFYFREPLPYNEMPPEVAAKYSEAYNPAPESAQSQAKIATLKARIEKELPDRIRRYRAGWDYRSHKVIGLEAWGRMVLEDLWRELDAETADLTGSIKLTWQEIERFTLEGFIDTRARNFVGREEILLKLLDLAHSPTEEEDVWGACITGSAGVGKSSLFAELQRRLQGGEALVLTHAAGVSPRSCRVDMQLRRWIGELAAFLEQTNPLTEQSKSEEVEEIFHRLLSLTSTKRRVILLIDALNQFEQTVLAQHLTWLPRLWPPNVRLIATTIPGTGSKALAQRPGMMEIPLPPLSEDEAAQIVQGICRRYHREINPAVVAALLEKKSENGLFSAGNPLWLELAVEELNLLDADDFSRMDQEFTGTPAERLIQLIVTVAREIPASIEGPYGWMIDRAENLFGKSKTKAFLILTALSRSGWRESDLKILIPTVSRERWDELSFAALRRTFRAHLTLHGPQEQWNFNHTQMRRAVLKRYHISDEENRQIQTIISDHLEGLPREDPLHESEFMIHLVTADDRQRAAHYYAGELTEGELAGATHALSDSILAEEGNEPCPILSWTVSLLSTKGLTSTERYMLCTRFFLNLSISLENSAIPRRLVILQASRDTLEIIAESLGEDLLIVLSYIYIQIGEMLYSQGNISEAEFEYRSCRSLNESLAEESPENATWKACIGKSRTKTGDLLRKKGAFEAAHREYVEALKIFEELTVIDPTMNSWQEGLVESHNGFGEVLEDQGDFSGAEREYMAGLEIIERLTPADHSNARRQRAIAVARQKIGDISFMHRGDVTAALQQYQTALEILERLTSSDPTDIRLQKSLAICHSNIGRGFRISGDITEALDQYRRALRIFKRLVLHDPTNKEWKRNVYLTYSEIGVALQDKGDFEEAISVLSKALKICEVLVLLEDKSNTSWKQNMALLHYRMGSVLDARAMRKAAKTHYSQCHNLLIGLKKEGVELRPAEQFTLEVLPLRLSSE